MRGKRSRRRMPSRREMSAGDRPVRAVAMRPLRRQPWRLVGIPELSNNRALTLNTWQGRRCARCSRQASAWRGLWLDARKTAIDVSIACNQAAPMGGIAAITAPVAGVALITAPVVGRRKARIVVRARGTNASEVAGRRERRRLHRQRRELSIAREGKLRGIPLADFDGGFTRVRGPLGATIVGLD